MSAGDERPEADFGSTGDNGSQPSDWVRRVRGNVKLCSCRIIRCLDRFNGVLIAIFTLFLVVVGYLQFRTFDRSDKTLRDTLIVNNRAWINVDGIEQRKQIVTDAESINFELFVHLHNVGRGPAVVRVYSNVVEKGKDWDFVRSNSLDCKRYDGNFAKTKLQNRYNMLAGSEMNYFADLNFKITQEMRKNANFLAAVTGCVLYTIDIRLDAIPHHTPFVGTMSALGARAPDEDYKRIPIIKNPQLVQITDVYIVGNAD
jgi:hypothetical protein